MAQAIASLDWTWVARYKQSTPTRLIVAAVASQSAGDALLPVRSIRYVQTAGVKPPKIAVARLNASENGAHMRRHDFHQRRNHGAIVDAKEHRKPQLDDEQLGEAQ